MGETRCQQAVETWEYGKAIWPDQDVRGAGIDRARRAHDMTIVVELNQTAARLTVLMVEADQHIAVR